MSACEPMEISLWMTSSTVRSVSMTNVTRLIWEEADAALHAELRRHVAIGIRQEREPE